MSEFVECIMSKVLVESDFSFDTRNFWIDNSGSSTNERFSDQTSSSGGPLDAHQEATYSTFSFEANGYTYNYVGSFTFSADFTATNGTVTASGTYDRIEVLAGGEVVSTYDGPSRSVDFGTYSNGGLLGLVGNLLGGVTDLLFGPQSEAYANLHTDATPQLPVLAFADGVNAVGGGGDDILTGGTTADRLDGRGGNDRLYGYEGDDTYVIRNAGDHAFEANGQGSDRVLSYVSYSIGADSIERLTLLGTGDIDATGNKNNNVMDGNAGANFLNGRGGEDLMRGYGGNDQYIVDSAGDRVVEAADGGRDVVRASIDYVLTDNVEILVLRGSGDIDGTGNRSANTILGNDGDNVINGKGGNDVLTGGAGTDSFVFDTDLVGNLDRIVDFTRGEDRIVLDSDIFVGLTAGTLDASAFGNIGGGAKADANDRVLYNSATGQLFFDADGSGAGAKVQFATLNNHAGLTADDFLIV
jgi:Ca2+-binding RTX toxin-like protein